jgi:tetratricopeptide (TPR) repeat protein
MKDELAWARVLAVAAGLEGMGPAAEALLLESLEALWRSNRAQLLVDSFVLLGYLTLFHGDLPAPGLVREQLAFYRSRGDRYATAIVAFSLGQISEGDGMMLEAQQHYRESLEIRRELRDLGGVSVCLDHIGFVTRELGDFEQARQLHLESLEISREIGNQLGVAGSLDNLGMVAWEEGDYGQAMRYYKQGLVIRRQMGRVWETGLSLHHLGTTALRQGDYGAAAAWFVESVHLLRTLPGRSAIALPLSGLGETCLAQGDREHARRHFRSALSNAARGRDVTIFLWIVPGICDFLAQTGRTEQAAEVFVTILQHPARWETRRAQAQRMLDELALRLPLETIRSLEARALAVDLNQLIASLLEEI